MYVYVHVYIVVKVFDVILHAYSTTFWKFRIKNAVDFNIDLYKLLPCFSFYDTLLPTA